MSSVFIENAKDLKEFYLETDITDVAAVQSAVKEISECKNVPGKEKYLEALHSAVPANISKARRYQKIVATDDIKSIILKNLGWVMMVVFFVMAMMFDDSGLFEESTVTWPYAGFWIGVGVQIYLAVLKNAWSKLTLSGTVIHSALKSTK